MCELNDVVYSFRGDEGKWAWERVWKSCPEGIYGSKDDYDQHDILTEVIEFFKYSLWEK